ncbi:hypothetical protein FPV67DRAFT_1660040 [Lyophyllum atratum]|nr:hypothetical protein FPV67DRAFT_1660040 [Lyophyllum atratum]
MSLFFNWPSLTSPSLSCLASSISWVASLYGFGAASSERGILSPLDGALSSTQHGTRRYRRRTVESPRDMVHGRKFYGCGRMTRRWAVLCYTLSRKAGWLEQDG